MKIVSKIKETFTFGKVAKTATAVGATLMAVTPAAFADTGANTLASDAETITGMATNVMGLFSTYPLNIILAMGLLGGVIGVVVKLKRGAR